MSAVLILFDRQPMIGRMIERDAKASGLCDAAAYSLGRAAGRDASRGASLADCRAKYLRPMDASATDPTGPEAA